MHGLFSRGGHGGDGGIEAGAEAYLEQSQGTIRRAIGSIPVGAVAIDMQRLGIGSLHGVVVLVERGHEKCGRAIIGMLYLEVGHRGCFFSLSKTEKRI